jgi:hypothetical protein
VGYPATHTAADATEALEPVALGLPDLVSMDIHLRRRVFEVESIPGASRPALKPVTPSWRVFFPFPFSFRSISRRQ